MDKLTIKDIAELAQVSKGTVSKALNGQPGVGKETRERILKLIKQLDFHPNSAAQSLASSKTENLGLFIPHIPYETISGSYWASIISGIVEQANLKGYNILLFTIERGGDLHQALNSILKKRRVDGFIVGAELLDQLSINSLCISKIPFVLLGQSPLLKHYFVDVDNYTGAYQMVEYMIKKGYKKIVCLNALESYTYAHPRLQGYLDAIKSYGLDFCHFETSPYKRENTIEAMEKLLGFEPDALFIGSGGEFLFDAIDILRDKDYKFPDFGLASFDDYYFMNYTTPRVTSVKQPFQMLGSSSVDMLCQMIEEGEPNFKSIVHPTEIISRESCGEKG